MLGRASVKVEVEEDAGEFDMLSVLGKILRETVPGKLDQEKRARLLIIKSPTEPMEPLVHYDMHHNVQVICRKGSVPYLRPSLQLQAGGNLQSQIPWQIV
jgi:hypothetical protein